MESTTAVSQRSAIDLARDRLAETVKDALGEKSPGTFELLVPPCPLADDHAKILFRTETGEPRAVVLLAPPLYPLKVTDAMQARETARLSLGDDLGSVILKTLRAGSVEGRSFSVMPYCRKLSSNALWSRVQNARLRPALLDWLRQSTKRTNRDLPDSERETALGLPLEHLASLGELSAGVRESAREARRLVDEAGFRPMTVLMHGDLSRGNLLKPPAASSSERLRRPIRPFVVIDWLGSKVRGYPIYDLVRSAFSLQIGLRQLRREVLAHCEILGCDPRHGRTYLLAALGHLGMNLQCFPYDWYLRQVEMCARAMSRVVA